MVSRMIPEYTCTWNCGMHAHGGGGVPQQICLKNDRHGMEERMMPDVQQLRAGNHERVRAPYTYISGPFGAKPGHS